MAFWLAQGGSNLYTVDPATGVKTLLTLPSGVTLSTTYRPKFAVLNQYVAIVNSPSRSLLVDSEGTLRVLVPKQPFSPPLLAAGSGTGYTGTRKVKVTFVVKDSLGNLIQESAMSPASNAVTFANQDMQLTRLPVSTDAVSARRIYITLTGGSVYYFLMDVDDNTTTSANLGSLSDASVQLLPAAALTLVAPPGTFPGSRLRSIVSWKSRLWGVADDPTLVDTVLYTESGSVYKWPNSLPAYPQGQDTQGIVGFAPRRDQLGVLKRDGLWQITGAASGSSGITNPVMVNITYGKAGCISGDTIVVINDRVYWLGFDGVYEWGPSGVDCISDSEVMPWFQSDTYFNRTQFGNAFAKYNPLKDTYELHLPNAGSSNIDRWVCFNLTKRKWFGPHVTAAFTPTSAALGKDANGLPQVMMGGSDGKMYLMNQTTFHDGTATAIDTDCYGPWHSMDAPDVNHFWGNLSMLTRVEGAGTLTVTPKIGGLNASAGSARTFDLTKGRERGHVLGDGRLCQLRFRKNTVDQGVVIYGYEIDPAFENGKR